MKRKDSDWNHLLWRDSAFVNHMLQNGLEMKWISKAICILTYIYMCKTVHTTLVEIIYLLLFYL